MGRRREEPAAALGAAAPGRWRMRECGVAAAAIVEMRRFWAAWVRNEKGTGSIGGGGGARIGGWCRWWWCALPDTVLSC
uniref:Gpm584 n=1 Tax=Arundo donax TaxID=35708 RepID=A0A0A9FID9_ARUDO